MVNDKGKQQVGQREGRQTTSEIDQDVGGGDGEALRDDGICLAELNEKATNKKHKHGTKIGTY